MLTKLLIILRDQKQQLLIDIQTMEKVDERMADERHMNLSILCPKTKHCGGFFVEDGKHICDCGEDFTEDVRSIYEATKKSLGL